MRSEFLTGETEGRISICRSCVDQRIDLSSSEIRRVARAIALACMAEREPRRGALHRWQAGRVCFSISPPEHSTSDIGQIRHTSQGLRSGTSKPWRPLNGRGETTYSKHTHVLERAGPDTLWNGVWYTLWYTLKRPTQPSRRRNCARLWSRPWSKLIDFGTCAISVCMVVSPHGALGNSTLGK